MVLDVLRSREAGLSESQRTVSVNGELYRVFSVRIG
jgi:hypothetical protein